MSESLDKQLCTSPAVGSSVAFPREPLNHFETSKLIAKEHQRTPTFSAIFFVRTSTILLYIPAALFLI